VDLVPPTSCAKPAVGPQPGLRSSSLGGAPELPHEYVLAGGGLQNSLIALAVLERRPETRLVLIEREAALGGNHTWCLHEGDIAPELRALVERLVVRRWPAHDVIFPRFRRRLPSAYSALTSTSLQRCLLSRFASAPSARVLTASVREVFPGQAVLHGGAELPGELIVDARGPEQSVLRAAGYQKFLGLELELAGGTAPSLPVLMDASVPQLDGFRFVYVLPWEPGRVLVEDTYYSKDPELDAPTLRERVLEYAERAGMRVRSVLREERGVLPLPSELPMDPARPSLVRAGYAGGLFHPTTGYSLPVALRFAAFLAARPASEALGAAFQGWREAHQRQARFCLLLNRLLFGAFAPEERYHVLERFYRLPESTIRRFYALETLATDRARILCGRPPRGFSLRRLLASGAPA
jgi:lycopene beta-cyclase